MLAKRARINKQNRIKEYIVYVKGRKPYITTHFPDNLKQTNIDFTVDKRIVYGQK